MLILEIRRRELKTNLAYINEATGSALAREMETPTIPKDARERAEKAGIKTIAGLTVNDESQMNEAFDVSLRQRKAAVEAYCFDRDRLSDDLGRLGITPLAILPKNAWDRICSTSGLFRLEPNEKGEVRISTTAMLMEFSNRTLLVLVRLCLSFVVLSALSSGSWMFHISNGNLWQSVTVAFFCGAVTFLIAAISWPIRRIEWMLNDVQFRLFGMQAHEKVLKAFFPEGTSPDNDDLLARIVLPEPPADVTAILLKASGLKLKVAVVAGALAFVESPREILRRRERGEREAYRGYRSFEEWLEKCPIVYCEHGDATAVIAQFGDFPVEKEVVDRVVNSEYLL